MRPETTGHPVRPITVRATIPAPPDVLFAYVADTRNDPEWCPNVDTVEMTGGDGVAVGSRFRFHQHLDRPGGDRLEFDADVEVTRLEEREITWLVSDRFQTREISLVVEPSGDGSSVTQVTRASFRRPPGLARFVYPFLARRTLRDQFRHLEAHFARRPRLG